ncbi:MAG: hypothetical protein INR66_02980 [Gordonia polyisoprenivorans]|nr:hypothetical protein [Gordonia polyisoprenivorans]
MAMDMRRLLNKKELKKAEKKLIRALDEIASGYCRNITHASKSYGVDDLSEFLSREQQEEWLADPALFNSRDDSELKPMTMNQTTKYSTAAQKYRDSSAEPALTRLLRDYLERCVPVPKQTEFQSWSVSAGTDNGRRAYCVSIGKMEAFVVFRKGDSFNGFINVRKSVLYPRLTSRLAFRRSHLTSLVLPADYHDAGSDTLTLIGRNPQQLARLIADPHVTSAAAQLVIDVARKHPSNYTQYHCPQLMEMVYPGQPREILPQPTNAG